MMLNQKLKSLLHLPSFIPSKSTHHQANLAILTQPLLNHTHFIIIHILDQTCFSPQMLISQLPQYFPPLFSLFFPFSSPFPPPIASDNINVLIISILGQ